MIDELHSPSTINYKVNEANTNIGRFVLVYNKTRNTLTLHALIASDFISRYNRKSVILSLGFQQSHGCDFFNGAECFYIEFFRSIKRGYADDRHFDREVDYAHSMFTTFTNDFDKICNYIIELNELVPQGYMHIPALTYSFEIDPELLKPKVSIPVWVEKEAPQQQLELRDGILNKIEILKNEFVPFSELLFQTGNELEQSVKRFFEFLGMTVSFTEKSFPVDLIATNDAAHFAIEVTGTNGNINNKDRKVGQSITYSGEKKDNEKVILAANTFRDQPIAKRPKESFTKEAVRILSPFNVCLVTTVNLYYFWKAILEGRETKSEVIKKLGETSGILE